MRDKQTWADVLGLVAGALALFGTVGIAGVELPLATVPLSARSLADALLTVSESLGDLPSAAERVSEVVAFLESVSGGSLFGVMAALCLAHFTMCGASIALAAVNLRQGHRTWRTVLAGSLAVADATAVAALCAAMSQVLYLVVRSVARGNPWAVGRGVAGLQLTLAPGLGLVVAGLLGVAAIAIALLARRSARP